MSPRAFLPAFFLISLAVVGQTPSSTPGLSVNAGYVTFASPASAAGASASGIAGTSDQTPIQPGVSQEASQAPVSDLAPTFYAGSNAAGTSGANVSVSLGEVSAQNKARNGAARDRTYTNADVQRLISHEGAGNAIEAANRPPAGIVAPGQNPPSPGNTALAPQSNLPTGSQQSAPASQQGSASAETSGANQSAPSNETRQNAGTTPQIAHSQPTEPQENGQQLPATSTMLPLLGLLGITASGIGLWLRRSRR